MGETEAGTLIIISQSERGHRSSGGNKFYNLIVTMTPSTMPENPVEVADLQHEQPELRASADLAGSSAAQALATTCALTEPFRVAQWCSHVCGSA